MTEQVKLTESADRREEVRVSQHNGVEHREHIIENRAAARAQTRYKTSQTIWFLTRVVEVLIGLRVILKFIAANPESFFAQLIYGLSDLFLWPFFDLTVTPTIGSMVLDLPAVIAMFVYALLAWGLVKIVDLLLERWTTQKISIYERDTETNRSRPGG